jgi:hypothetical protein
MQESPNQHFYYEKEKDMSRHLREYNQLRYWQIDPESQKELKAPGRKRREIRAAIKAKKNSTVDGPRGREELTESHLARVKSVGFQTIENRSIRSPSQSHHHSKSPHSRAKSPQLSVASSNQLTHERLHALKVMAENNQLVPIIVENKKCSHMSFDDFPINRIVHANDLHALDKTNPFRFWQDR